MFNPLLEWKGRAVDHGLCPYRAYSPVRETDSTINKCVCAACQKGKVEGTEIIITFSYTEKSVKVSPDKQPRE